MFPGIVRRGLFAIGCFLSVGVATPVLGQLTVPYEGAARLFTLEPVTVVYPANPPDRAGINRDSAELRAQFLGARYDIDTVVVSDEAITDEQRQGHLLVLGWDNALLHPEGEPPPFTRTVEGFSFGGVTHPNLDDDLIFTTRSPYAEAAWLTFWSRIDAELERFLVLPFLGSDWGIFATHNVIRQGMFDREAPSWPPTVNLSADHSEPLRRPGPLARSKHYDLMSPATPVKDAEGREILAAREAALAKAISWLGDPGDDFRISLFVYWNTKEKGTYSGAEDPAHSIPRDLELHMTKAGAASAVPHEEIHLVAQKRLGPCYLTAMYEGLALALESGDDPVDLAVFAAMMIERDSIPSFATLFADEELRKISEGDVGFPAAALLVNWIRTTGGPDDLQAAYSFRAGTAASELAQMRGVSEQEAEAQFLAWIALQAEQGRDELAIRKALQEADVLGRAGDYEGGIAAFRQALSLEPDDTAALYSLGLMQMKADDNSGAQETFEKLVAMEVAPSELHFVLFGHYQLGKLHQMEGQSGRAVQSYEKMLELPDRSGAHGMAKEAIAAASEPSAR